MKNTDHNKNLFKDIVGQEFAKKFLKATLEKGRISTAYLFSGPDGVGKKLTTFCFLEGLLTGGNASTRERRRLESNNHPDLLWIEPTYQNQGRVITKSQAAEEGLISKTPPQIRLEQIREAGKFLSKIPLEAKFGLVVIEDVEKMAEAAANALLKTLEEPRNGIIILITSRPEKLLQTIHSRCQKIPFYSLNKNDFKQIIINIDSQHNINLTETMTESELEMISSGSPGALIENSAIFSQIPDNLWPQLKKLPRKPIDALKLAKEISESLNIECQIWLINWLQYNIWNKLNNDIYINRLEKLRSQLLSFVQPRLAWEVALLEIKDT